MKQAFKTSVIIVLILSMSISSCRKGDEDPFFSFRSRTTRLTGNWELTNAKIRIERIDNGITTTTYSLSGTKMSVIIANVFTGNRFGSYEYTERVSFDKDGTYSYNNKTDNKTFSANGNWMWVRDNETIDLEDEEAIILTTTSDSEGNLLSGITNIPTDLWVFNKLSNEELIVEIDRKVKYNNGGSVAVYGKLTYEQ